MSTSAPILEWRDGQPVSREFGDVYFSRASGVEETRYVFLEGNRLLQRIAALDPDAAFTIGETGFGTGLNFLCAWQLFDRVAPATARLHFVSCELHPLAVSELRAALELWPELAPYSQALISSYGPLAPGWHRFVFASGRACLTLLVGDVRQTLVRLDGAVDAWFLDGFSPARNPQMWEPPVLRAIADHSRPGATLATYTSAGAVRRGLEEVGFRVERVKGFGPKREMIRGEYAASAALRPPVRRAPRDAVVVGGGLAGTAAARSLAMRGWRVTLIERHANLAAEASGNPQGVLYARLSATATPLSQLVLAGYQHSLRVLRELLPCDGAAWSAAPVIQLAHDEHEARRQARVRDLGLPAGVLRGVDRDEASALAGLALPSGGVLFPLGGWAHPPALCRALADHPNIRVLLSRGPARVSREPGAACWTLYDAQGPVADSETVILATGAGFGAIEPLARLPLRVNRGQITLVPATAESSVLRAVLCAESYVAPARGGWHSVGATFARADSEEPTVADNAENLAMLARLALALFDGLGGAQLDPARLAGRAGLRCVSPDYLPVLGALDQDRWPGLYATTAHGSRGLLSAPLGGEVLAALLEGEPAPLPSDLIAEVSAGRFSPLVHVP
jgi:tRNA 5-methylaminomethyl-2-thiouridine biosynthesis bifunctional protein